MANATVRTPKTGETLPAVKPVAPSNAVRKTAIGLICPTCALEYCPNFLRFAAPDVPLAAQFLDKKQKCGICGSRSQIGVSDPANYGGIHPTLEK